jgi:hypothetical protein
MTPEFLSVPRRFECTRCNGCCSGQPGYVWLSQKDLSNLSEFTGLSKRMFALTYCKPVDIGLATTLSLKEKRNHDCIFLESTGCSVYPARPAQCRTYPFWEPILEDEEHWASEGKECPGIGKGPIISPETIIHSILERRENPPLSIDDIVELQGLEKEWGI